MSRGRRLRRESGGGGMCERLCNGWLGVGVCCGVCEGGSRLSSTTLVILPVPACSAAD